MSYNGEFIDDQEEWILLKTSLSILEGNDAIGTVPGKIPSLDQRKNVVFQAVNFIQSSSYSGPESLYQKYLNQFSHWKLGCDSSSFITKWLMQKIDRVVLDCSTMRGNILLVHVIARKYEMELMHLVSWVDPIHLSIPYFRSLKSYIPTNPTDTSQGGKVLQNIMADFEQSLSDAFDPQKQWVSSFSLFLARVHAVLSYEMAVDISFFSHLRVLGFFFVLARASAPSHVVKIATLRLFNKRERTIDIGNESLSLASFIGILAEGNGSEEWIFDCTILLFRHFFSSSWMDLSKDYRTEDTKFLISFLINSCNGHNQRHLFVMLLQNACSAKTRREGDPLQKTHPTLGLLLHPLQLICSGVCCESLMEFSTTGKRSKIPHYVPIWLRGEEGIKAEEDEHLEYDAVALFFSHYQHSYSCDLADAMFDIVLNKTIVSAENTTSEEILRSLLHDIETECYLDHQDMIKLSEARSSSSGDCGSLFGSTLNAMLIDAKVLCFVSKVAYELAISSEATALYGTNAEKGHAVLGKIMTTGGSKWQEYLFSSIIRIRGEGQLISLLSDEGALHVYWARPWLQGLPSARHGCEASLQKAEDELNKAFSEEDKKTREYRHCPNPDCARLFGVDNKGCGRFICGRDAHTTNEAPTIGGQGVKDTYGCGVEFDIQHATPYSPNKTILNPLKKVVEEETCRLQENRKYSPLWNGLTEFNVPPLICRIENVVSLPPLLPTSFFLKALSDDSSSNELLQCLVKERENFKHFQMLPTFIEVSVYIFYGR